LVMSLLSFRRVEKSLPRTARFCLLPIIGSYTRSSVQVVADGGGVPFMAAFCPQCLKR
jgi:hypothetical protein